MAECGLEVVQRVLVEACGFANWEFAVQEVGSGEGGDLVCHRHTLARSKDDGS